MTRYSLAVLCCLCTVCLSSIGLAGSDRDREARWANEIGDAIMTGDVTWLKAGDLEFMAIYTPAETDTAKGAVIVVHGSGVHPNWPDVVYPLRTQLPERGWATLAIQMPVLAADARGQDYYPVLPEVPPRMDAAIAFLKAQGFERISVASHSFGNLMVSYWLINRETTPVVGFVGVGMTFAEDDDGNLAIAKHLEKLTIPVLDLYGSEDMPEIIAFAPARAASAAKAGNEFKQIVSPGADHFFRGEDDALVDTVAAWLDNL